MKEKIDINDYKDDLGAICVKCPRLYKCKDTTAICYKKKVVFNIAKGVYAKRLEKECKKCKQ